MIPLGDSVPANRWPAVTYALIAASVWVFLYEVALGHALEPFIHAYRLIPAPYFLLAQTEPWNWLERYLPLFTSMFLHGGWGRVVGPCRGLRGGTHPRITHAPAAELSGSVG
jgi:membrane associated rhomboid family serine protease